jgi:MoaA/NifB/PqqE/SkfB family radical SAM enzyme
LSLAEVTAYLDEIKRDGLPTRLIGFTGGEPFMNAAFPAMLEEALARGFETLTLTNAMRPMMRWKDRIATLASRYGEAMRLRVSLDHYRAEVHDRERGLGSFAKTMKGLQWLVSRGVAVELAGRRLPGEAEHELRSGFAHLARALAIPVDARSASARDLS